MAAETYDAASNDAAGFEHADGILIQAEAFVKEHFKNHDPSHDWHHVHRVRLLALWLSQCGSLATPVDLLVLELGALFHDLCDSKYAPAGSSGPASASSVLSGFLSPFVKQGVLSNEEMATVFRIVDNVSWSKDVKRRARRADAQRQGGQPLDESELEQLRWEEGCAEYACVCDADRLDAIGSIGILRCAAYSAHTMRPLHIPPANPEMSSVPPAEQESGYNNSAVAHFHDKLLHIRGDRLRTSLARAEAERRQSMMRSFLDELELEWIVGAQGAQLTALQDDM